MMWLTYKIVELGIQRAHRNVLATGITTDLCIIVTIITAVPWVRRHHHNFFERHHRFLGWAGIIFTYVFVAVGNGYNPQTGKWDPSGRFLISTQEFWFILAMSFFVALPWFFVRKVPVEIETPSSKMAIIKFKRGMQQGLLGRVSRTALFEYHIFGIISQGTDSDCHYMVCGVQGDFTKQLVADPPKYLWTREVKVAGVSNSSKMYRRGIRIATGTGIGAAMGTVLQSKDWFLIWIGSGMEETFGPTLMGLANTIEPERRILWDSKKMGGRPNTMDLLEACVKSWGAEVVFITSNDAGNRELMLGCLERGIPAFGTLFDF